jgi:hypothetical protein
MTRRKEKGRKRKPDFDREARIKKLIATGWIASGAEIPLDAIPVDPDKLNLGGSYFAPRYFKSEPFTCCDCGVSQVWEAEDQRWYFETSGAPYYSTAKRCRPCREKEQSRKAEARIAAGHAKPEEGRDDPPPSKTLLPSKKPRAEETFP